MVLKRDDVIIYYSFNYLISHIIFRNICKSQAFIYLFIKKQYSFYDYIIDKKIY